VLLAVQREGRGERAIWNMAPRRRSAQGEVKLLGRKKELELEVTIAELPRKRRAAEGRAGRRRGEQPRFPA